MVASARRPIAAVGLGCALMVGATASLQTAEANGDTRTLSIVNIHNNERITVTFKRDGRYDADGLRQLNHFLRDWRLNQSIEMNPRLIDLVWEVYRDVGGTQPIQLICGYRAPATNSMLRARSSAVAEGSQHTRGNAMDFHIPGVALSTLRERGMVRQRGGVGFYPGGEGGFVHLDVGSVRAWPRMSRDQLARLFPNGQTVHLPSDGRPLAGYDVAMARLRQGGGSDNTVLAYAGGSTGRDGAEDGSPTRASVGSGAGILARLFGGGEAAPTPAATPATTRAVAARRAPAATPPAAAPAPAAPTLVAAAAPAATERTSPTRTAEPRAEQRTVVAALPVPLPPTRPALPAALATAEPVPVPQPRPAAADTIITVASADAAAIRAAVPLPLPRPEAEQAAGIAVAALGGTGTDAIGDAAAEPAHETLAAAVAPAVPAVELVALDLSHTSVRAFMQPDSARHHAGGAALSPSAGLALAAAPEAVTGFGAWRTGRTDTFAGPAVRNLMAMSELTGG